MNTLSIMEPSLVPSSTSTPQEQLLPTTPKVPPEILLKIFKNLHRSEPLSELRLVTRQFYNSTIDLYYRHVTLTDKLIAAFSLKQPQSPQEVIQCKVVGYMKDYTQDISIKSHLREDASLDCVKYLLSLTKLRSIKWSRSDLPKPLFRVFDYQIISNQSLRTERPTLKFHIEGLDMTQMSPGAVLDLQTLHLVSFKTSNWYAQLQDFETRTDVLIALKTVLLNNPGLQTLHLVSSNKSAQLGVKFEDNEKLPAIRELVLNGYNWSFNERLPPSYWNWSKIRSLDLKRVSIVKFLQTVVPEHLSQVRVFMTDGYCSRGEESLATDLIYRLINQIEALEKLSVRVLIPKIYRRDCMREIIRHGPTLHTLEVRTYAEVPLLPSLPCRTWTNEASEVIQRSCPWLTELTLDWEGCTMSVQKLARFRNLRKLTVFRDLYTEASPQENIDSQLARRDQMLLILKRKQGVSFEEISWNVKVYSMSRRTGTSRTDLSASRLPPSRTLIDIDAQERLLLARLAYSYRRVERVVKDEISLLKCSGRIK